MRQGQVLMGLKCRRTMNGRPLFEPAPAVYFTSSSKYIQSFFFFVNEPNEISSGFSEKGAR